MTAAPKKPTVRSLAEEAFVNAWKAIQPDGGEFVREHHFCEGRLWRFDFAWPALKLAVEIDGRGRHQTVAGVRADLEKHNAAQTLGWCVLRFPATDKRNANDWARETLIAATELV
jgi:very-short-patch-repair endonuclease